jgi:ADP-heptose:LPS heptosyltransferase
MKILVRLPNWLGDMVMSTGFLSHLPAFFPGAEVSLIAKKGIHSLLRYFPTHRHVFLFDKKEHKGFKGLKKFGEEIRETEKFDLFFSLPNSFSAAVLAYTSGSTKRVGYKKELRQLMLTDSYPKPAGLHRADEYTRLLELFTEKSIGSTRVLLPHQFEKKDHVVVNINSEASSRRLTLNKSVELVETLRKQINHPISLVGSPKEKELVDAVIAALPQSEGIINSAGTNLDELAEILASARLVISTDSGPAHLANAMGTHTIVMVGAGRESHTAPYNEQWRTIIRLGQLSCEPCEKNVCVRFELPQCLERLDTQMIVQTAKLYLQ